MTVQSDDGSLWSATQGVSLRGTREGGDGFAAGDGGYHAHQAFEDREGEDDGRDAEEEIDQRETTEACNCGLAAFFRGLFIRRRDVAAKRSLMKVLQLWMRRPKARAHSRNPPMMDPAEGFQTG
jgi:hypothetical protein